MVAWLGYQSKWHCIPKAIPECSAIQKCLYLRPNLSPLTSSRQYCALAPKTMHAQNAHSTETFSTVWISFYRSDQLKTDFTTTGLSLQMLRHIASPTIGWGVKCMILSNWYYFVKKTPLKAQNNCIFKKFWGDNGPFGHPWPMVHRILKQLFWKSHAAPKHLLCSSQQSFNETKPVAQPAQKFGGNC